MGTKNWAWTVWFVVAAVFLGPGTARCGERKEETLGRARQMAEAGRFGEADTLLRTRIADPDAPVVDDLAVELEILRRIRLGYSLTSDQVLEQLRKSIPDVTIDDMDTWRESGVLQHRVIDGEVWYFNRAVSNLFRACPAAKARRQETVTAPRAFDFPTHLARLVAEAKQTGRSEVHPVKHRVRFTLRVKEGHPRLKKGAEVRCWLPFPQEYRQQRQVKLLSAVPAEAAVAPNGHPQRTVYFEATVDNSGTAPAFTAEFEFVTSAYTPQLDPAKVEPYDTTSELYRKFTAERPPHIVFTPEVKKLAEEIVGAEESPLEKAMRVFRWVSQEIRWCSEMEYSTVPNLSAKGIARGEGDCGVQGMVFITLCRAAGVPARWQSGWQSKPDRWNMHDWSEFYVEPWGWLPADASNGLQEYEDVRVREFFCGHMDPYRLIVNLDYGRELDPPKHSFRSEPNDFQRGEIEIDGHNLYFDEWERETSIRTIPLDGGMACLEESLDAVVPKEMKAGKVSGAVILVGRRTKSDYETWQKAYGLKQTEPEPVVMPVDAVFDMASMTKPIATGTSLMILVEQGDVALDDPVGKYLPEFDTDKKRGVTIRHLMTHMSGMPAYVGAAQRKPVEVKAGFPCAEAIRDFIRTLPLTRKPGEVKVYSCLNAILCEEVIRKVSGKPLDAFAAENVFKPLGMDETGFNPETALCIRCVPSTREPWAVAGDGFLQGQVHDPLAAMQAGVSGNAGLFSTVADLSRFAQMMLNGGELDRVRVLKEKTIRDMTRVQNPGAVNTSGNPDRRGLLWDLYVPDPGDTGVDAIFAYGHTGYTGTAIRIYPKQGVYVIALTNRVHPDDTSSVGAIRAAVWGTVGAVLMGTEAL